MKTEKTPSVGECATERLRALSLLEKKVENKLRGGHKNTFGVFIYDAKNSFADILSEKEIEEIVAPLRK